jgi:hypothetical protein
MPTASSPVAAVHVPGRLEFIGNDVAQRELVLDDENDRSGDDEEARDLVHSKFLRIRTRRGSGWWSALPFGGPSDDYDISFQ